MGVSTVSFLFLLRSGSTLHFPPESARLVWRITSITTISFSALTLGLNILAFFTDDNLELPFCPHVCGDVVGVTLCIWLSVFSIGMVPFLLARVVLLVSSVICLKSVPPGDVVVSRSWVDYIPHFS